MQPTRGAGRLGQCLPHEVMLGNLPLLPGPQGPCTQGGVGRDQCRPPSSISLCSEHPHLGKPQGALPAHCQAFCLPLIPRLGAPTTVPDQRMQTEPAVAVTSILLGGPGCSHPAPLAPLARLPPCYTHIWELGRMTPKSLQWPWNLMGF